MELQRVGCNLATQQQLMAQMVKDLPAIPETQIDPWVKKIP